MTWNISNKDKLLVSHFNYTSKAEDVLSLDAVDSSQPPFAELTLCYHMLRVRRMSRDTQWRDWDTDVVF